MIREGPCDCLWSGNATSSIGTIFGFTSANRFFSTHASQQSVLPLKPLLFRNLA